MFDPWKDPGVQFLATFELLCNQLNSCYKINSGQPYYVYCDRASAQKPPIYVSMEKHPNLRGELVGLISVDECQTAKNASFKAHLIPLNEHYRVISPNFWSAKKYRDEVPVNIDNNQAEFNLGYVLRVAYKKIESDGFSVKVERVVPDATTKG